MVNFGVKRKENLNVVNLDGGLIRNMINYEVEDVLLAKAYVGV